MRQVVGFAYLSTERVLLGAHFGTPLYPTATSRRTCATVPQPSELRFGVVRAVDRGIAVLDGGQRSVTGRGGFRGFCSPLSQWEMPLRRRRKTFPIRMRTLHDIYVRQTIRGLFGDIAVDFAVKIAAATNRMCAGRCLSLIHI